MKAFATRRRQMFGMLAFFAVLVILTVMPVAAAEKTTTYRGVNYARVYDYNYYTSETHPELAGKSGAAVLKYFVTEGIPAGEQAKESFSVKSYRNGNADLRKDFGMDYAKYVNHYLTDGYNDGRTTTGCDDEIKDPVTRYNGQNYDKVYDFHYYVKHNWYVRKHYKEDDYGALKYFVERGISKKHQACENFNVTWYYNSTPNMRYMCGFEWDRYYLYYQRSGYKKGPIKRCDKIAKYIDFYKIGGSRIDLSAIYDFEYYTKHNASARKFWDTQDDAGAVKHFISYGIIFEYQAKQNVGKNNPKYIAIRKKMHPNINTNAYLKASGYSSPTPWLILVNQNEHMVYVFHGSKGNWICKYKYPCCVGAPSTPTPVGQFYIYGHGYYFDSGSCRCFYYSPFYGSYYFHSVLYYQTSTPQSIMDGRLGYSISHGCVRLALNNAKWIHDNIPVRTTVVTYNRPW